MAVHLIRCTTDQRVVTMVVPGKLARAEYVLAEMLFTSTSLVDYTEEDFSVTECKEDRIMLDPGGMLFDCKAYTDIEVGGFNWRSYTSKIGHVSAMLGGAKERVRGYVRVGATYCHVFVPIKLRDELIDAFNGECKRLNDLDDARRMLER